MAVYKRGKVVEFEGLKLGEDDVRATKPKDTYKFLGIEEVEGIAKNIVLARNVLEWTRGRRSSWRKS